MITQVVNEYQEQTIQAAREIADNFLESQKEIINSFQLACVPRLEAANRAFNANWMSPIHFADNYARVVSNFADNTMAVTRLVNNTIFANLEAFKTCVQNARDNVKELTRIGVNSARTVESKQQEIQLVQLDTLCRTRATTTTTSPHYKKEAPRIELR